MMFVVVTTTAITAITINVLPITEDVRAINLARVPVQTMPAAMSVAAAIPVVIHAVLIHDVVTIAHAVRPVMTTARILRRGKPFHVRLRMNPCPITVASAVKALSILSNCVVSVRKRPACTVKTPVRHCLPAVRTLSFVRGSCNL